MKVSEKSEKKVLERRDIDVNEIFKIEENRTVGIPSFRVRNTICLPEFGGKLRRGGLAFLVTSPAPDYKKKQGFIIKKARPRGKVSFAPVSIRDRIILSKEIEIANGRATRTVIGEVLDVGEEITLIIKHSGIGVSPSFPCLPETLKMALVEKLSQDDTKIMYMNVLRIYRNVEGIEPKYPTQMVEIENEHELINIYRENFPAIGNIIFDPVKKKLIYNFFSLEGDSPEYIFSGYVDLVKVFRTNAIGQHVFNASTNENLEKVLEKLTSNNNRIFQGLR